MTEDGKKMLAIGVILFILAIFALHSVLMLRLNPKKAQEPFLAAPVQTAEPSVSAPAPEAPLSSDGSHPVVSIPTAEEIKLSIEDQNQKQKAMEELMATRDRKAKKVMAAATAALSSAGSQETVSEDSPPPLSPEARAERNKELRDGIKAHRYFPR